MNYWPGYYTRGILFAGTLCFLLLLNSAWQSFGSSRPAATSANTSSSRWRPQHQPAKQDEAAGLTKQICNGSFAYLILGEAYPAKKWVRRSRWPRTSLVYVSWRENVSRSLLRDRITGPKFRYLYMPRSTWATARNRQMELMKDVEVDQGWRFEFVIYLDEDVSLGVRNLGRFKTIVLEENDDFAFRRLLTLLMQDTPFVAGISDNDVIEDDQDNATCVQRCVKDHMLVAMHRTAVDVLPPYETRLDNVTWWASAYMLNAYMAVMMPQFCNFYREITVDMDKQKHGDYPRTDLDLHPHAKQLAADQLVRLGIPGIPNNANVNGSAVCCWLSRLIRENRKSLLRPPCQANHRRVDFKTLTRTAAQSFCRITEWQSEPLSTVRRCICP